MNAAMVKDRLVKLYGWSGSEKFIRRVMRNDEGMRFRKVKVGPKNINSEKCLVLRQQYALTLLKLLAEGKRVINLDETWLNFSTYATKEWRAKDDQQVRPQKTIRPRFAVIVAISTDGKFWWSASQGNTDSSVVMSFMLGLTELLDYETPGWRKNTVFLCDGAPYHTSQLM